MSTIAFSTKSLDWKTRYSFKPMHYAETKGTMISFYGTAATENNPDSSGVHTHDTNPKYNLFYGTAYPSSLSVISNENPSATKIYEAFSLECSKGNWSAKFTTETGPTQTSSFPAGALVEKEGKHYIDIPKNSLNRAIGLKYVGQTTIGALRAADSSFVPDEYNAEIQMSGRIVSVPNAYLAFALPMELSVEQAEFIIANGGTANDLLNYLALSKNPFVYEPTALSNNFYNVDEFDPNLTLGPMWPRFNASTNSIEMPYFEVETFDQAFGINGNTVYDDVPLAVYTTSSSTELNGEDMRGEYMKIDISRTGTDYYELYAINVDQHNTKLDHSLGQNN